LDMLYSLLSVAAGFEAGLVDDLQAHLLQQRFMWMNWAKRLSWVWPW
jgi:hypothetical protein